MATASGWHQPRIACPADRERCMPVSFWWIALLVWLLPALVLAPMLLWTGRSGRRRPDRIHPASAVSSRDAH